MDLISVSHLIYNIKTENRKLVIVLLREPKMVLLSYYFAHTLKVKAENIRVHNSMFTGFVMGNPRFLLHGFAPGFGLLLSDGNVLIFSP